MLSAKRIGRLPLLMAAAGVLYSSAVCSSAVNTESDAVAQLREALTHYNSLDLKASVHTDVSQGINVEDVPTIEDSVLLVKRLGSRALVSRKSKTVRHGVDPAFTQNDFVLYDNGDVLSCQADLDTSLRQRNGVTDNLIFMLYSERLAGVQRVDAASMYEYLNDSGAVVWVVGYAPLRDYLDSGQLEVKATDDGAEITAKSRNGNLTLKLSKAHGWLPQWFHLNKGPGDKTVGGLVADVYGKGISNVTWTGEVADFQSDGAGHWFPQHMNVSRKTSFSNGREGHMSTAITIDNLVYNPALTASDFRSDIVAPASFPVTVAGATYLPYRWDGKMVVPGAPELPDRTATAVTSSGAGIRWTLLVLNILLVIVVLILLWKKRASAPS